MNLKISEQYEDLATEWQYQMILILKKALAKFGVDENQAKEIVGEFAFDFSMLHDQGEIKVEGNSFNPRISFDDFSGNLILSDEESNLHEYAFGSTSEAYGE
ncbi:hypothetical protein MWU49_11020 [Alcanivorax sp. S6407]|uniref:hypothetical protein n=1 Tax=Alcanivorax sp. S6407 TaxID=2926424 RepID=UPI001FF65600|nr:hypothetical protein [Alcanivorax sp. S6407]MCK0154235.1 hypothetical protein [Alcanivorax sp. S6407]